MSLSSSDIYKIFLSLPTSPPKPVLDAILSLFKQLSIDDPIGYSGVLIGLFPDLSSHSHSTSTSTSSKPPLTEIIHFLATFNALCSINPTLLTDVTSSDDSIHVFTSLSMLHSSLSTLLPQPPTSPSFPLPFAHTSPSPSPSSELIQNTYFPLIYQILSKLVTSLLYPTSTSSQNIDDYILTFYTTAIHEVKACSPTLLVNVEKMFSIVTPLNVRFGGEKKNVEYIRELILDIPSSSKPDYQSNSNSSKKEEGRVNQPQSQSELSLHKLKLTSLVDILGSNSFGLGFLSLALHCYSHSVDSVLDVLSDLLSDDQVQREGAKRKLHPRLRGIDFMLPEMVDRSKNEKYQGLNINNSNGGRGRKDEDDIFKTNTAKREEKELKVIKVNEKERFKQLEKDEEMRHYIKLQNNNIDAEESAGADVSIVGYDSDEELIHDDHDDANNKAEVTNDDISKSRKGDLYDDDYDDQYDEFDPSTSDKIIEEIYDDDVKPNQLQELQKPKRVTRHEKNQKRKIKGGMEKLGDQDLVRSMNKMLKAEEGEGDFWGDMVNTNVKKVRVPNGNGNKGGDEDGGDEDGGGEGEVNKNFNFGVDRGKKGRALDQNGRYINERKVKAPPNTSDQSKPFVKKVAPARKDAGGEGKTEEQKKLERSRKKKTEAGDRHHAKSRSDRKTGGAMFGAGGGG